MKGEKITGLRFEINRGLDVDPSGFLAFLKKKLEETLPKFKIHKIALQENWQEMSRFVCLVHSKKIATLNPVFKFEFAGFTLSSSKNSRTVKFALAFGKSTKVYMWDAETRTFISKDRLKTDITDTTLSPALIKKQKLPENGSIRNLEDLDENFKEKTQKLQSEFIPTLEKMFKEEKEQNKKKEEVFIEMLKRISQQQAELLTLVGKGQSPSKRYKQPDSDTRIDDMKEQRTDLENEVKDKNEGFKLSSKMTKKVKELSNEVENLKNELFEERRKNWLDDEQLNTYVQALMKGITCNANVCSTHSFELLKSQVRLKAKVEELSVANILVESGITVGKVEFNLFPINYDDNHWALLLWKVTEGEFFYFDSLGCNAEKVLLSRRDSTEEACKFLREYVSKKDSKRKIKVHEVKVPIQTNKEDCGALVLAMAERLIQGTGNQMKDLNSSNCKSLLSDWFDSADEAYNLRKKLSTVLGMKS